MQVTKNERTDKTVKEYGNLSLEQQSKLMKQIDNLRYVDCDDRAKENAKELIDFIFALESHCFITPDKRCRYQLGIEDAMERRRNRLAENKC